ncbi:hypothetical protein VTN31DRAFT_4822 [Thermomyces dupontii]|uniref:uncharacterized protein n=1 Tax=Talaromyces thermophilus TaxID=28565 RepID=UPI0037439EE9
MLDSESEASRASVVLVPTILTTGVAIILTGLRIYVRTNLIKQLGWDDIFNVIATMHLIVVMALVLSSVSHGFGRHWAYLNNSDAVFSLKLLRIAEFMLIMCTVFLKISIALFLIRLFAPSNSTRKNILVGLTVFNAVVSVVDAVIIFPQCSPTNYNWDRSIPGGHCWPTEVIDGVGIIQGSVAGATDIALSALPIYFLWNMRMKTRHKLGVWGVLALGFASGGFAIERTVLVPSLTATKDPTWDLIYLFTWAILEATFGVIAAAVPAVRPLFRRKKTPAGVPCHTPPLVPLNSVQTECTGNWAIDHRRRTQRESRLQELTFQEILKDKDDIEQQTVDSSSCQGDLCVGHGGIMRTTDLVIEHEQTSRDVITPTCYSPGEPGGPSTTPSP